MQGRWKFICGANQFESEVFIQVRSQCRQMVRWCACTRAKFRHQPKPLRHWSNIFVPASVPILTAIDYRQVSIHQCDETTYAKKHIHDFGFTLSKVEEAISIKKAYIQDKILACALFSVDNTSFAYRHVCDLTQYAFVGCSYNREESP